MGGRLREVVSGVELPLEEPVLEPPVMEEEPGNSPRPSASSSTTGSTDNLYRASKPEATAMPPATTSLKAVCRRLLMAILEKLFWINNPLGSRDSWGLR